MRAKTTASFPNSIKGISKYSLFTPVATFEHTFREIHARTGNAFFHRNSGMLEYRNGLRALLIGMISKPTGMYASLGMLTPVTEEKNVQIAKTVFNHVFIVSV